MTSPSIGDVFQVPLDEHRVVYGQLVGFVAESPYIVLFRGAQERDAIVELGAVVDRDIALMTAVESVNFKRGEWRVLGRAPLARLAFAPAFKLGVAQIGFQIISLDGVPRRSATVDEVASLEYPTIRGAASVEKAVRALHGLEPEFKSYPELLFQAVRRNADAAGTATHPLVESGLASPKPREPRAPEQSVVVHIPLGPGGYGSSEERRRLRAMTDELVVALEKANVGWFDGDEWGQGEFTLYLYGPDADKVLSTVLPLLGKAHLPPTSYATKRRGDPDDPSTRAERVPLTQSN